MKKRAFKMSPYLLMVFLLISTVMVCETASAPERSFESVAQDGAGRIYKVWIEPFSAGEQRLWFSRTEAGVEVSFPLTLGFMSETSGPPALVVDDAGRE